MVHGSRTLTGAFGLAFVAFSTFTACGNTAPLGSSDLGGPRAPSSNAFLPSWVPAPALSPQAAAPGPLAVCNAPWFPTGSLAQGRYLATATRLPSGTVVVVGGWADSGMAPDAELYNPATGTWTAAGTLNIPRYWHRAVGLQDGRVLVVGGYTDSGSTPTTEIYDPGTNTWSLAASMSNDRFGHQLTVLSDGRVLASGGIGGGLPSLTTAEVYDPEQDVWSPVGSMATARYVAGAARLPDGRVLVAGGNNGLDYQSSAEIFDPSSGTWSAAPSMSVPRYAGGAVVLQDGRVLIAGGSTDLPGAEIYNPASGTWSSTGVMVKAPRYFPETVRLSDGRVLVAGGVGSLTSVVEAEVFDPDTNAWSQVSGLNTPRNMAASTSLLDGRVLVVGGQGEAGITGTAELYQGCPKPACAEPWSYTGGMAQDRYMATATRLTDGTVVVAGGSGASGLPITAERYNPTTGTWSAAGTLSGRRAGHQAVRLQNGRILVAGGTGDGGSPIATVEIYNPATNAWSAAASMSTPRNLPQITLLSNGRVLVSGGIGELGPLATAEVYDPQQNTWSTVGSMGTPRSLGVSVLLSNGRVLIAGGHNGTEIQSSAEIFNPSSGTWSAARSMASARYGFGAVVLSDGRVVVAGGSTELPGAEIYNPSSNTWSPTGNMIQVPRYFFETIQLTDGRVLVAGGVGDMGLVDWAEIFDAGTGRWVPVAGMNTSRHLALSALLPDGRVLLAGGFGGAGITNTAETYMPCPPNQAPIARCRNRFASAGPTCRASLSVNRGSYDPDDGPEALTLTQSPAGPYRAGYSRVTLTASDGSLTDTCSAWVVVVDNTDPVITCPAPPAPLECVNRGATAGTYRATYTDNCSSPGSVTCWPSGQWLWQGTHTATCTARDGWRNRESCHFPITVRDTVPPVPGGSRDMVLWPRYDRDDRPDHRLHHVDLSDCARDATDACRGRLDIDDYGRITHVTSDEVEDDPGSSDGDTKNDIVITGRTSVRLRQERDRALDGRVYTIHYTVNDNSGNYATSSCKISVRRYRRTPATDSGPRYCVGRGC